MKTLKQIREASGGKEAYQKFFNSLLKKFGVDSPSELDDKKKKEFFNAVDKGWDGDNEKAEAEVKVENSDDFKDDTDVSDDRGNYSGVDEEAPPGMENVVKKLKADGNSDEEAFAIAWSAYNSKKNEERNYYNEGKRYPVMNAGQRVKIIKIAKKHSGDMERAIKDIEKLKRGMSDNPDVMDILRKANEDIIEGKVFNKDRGIFKALLSLSKKKEYKKVSKAFVNLTMPSPMAKDKEIAKGLSKRLKQLADKLGKKEKAHVLRMADLASTYESVEEAVDCDGRLLGFKAATRRKEGEKQKGKVIVDRRTKGYKEAQLRSEKAKAKREEKRKQIEFAEKYPKIDYNNNTKEENDILLKKLNKNFVPETAANAVSAGGIDMAPNAGKKKKDKFKVVKRANY